MATTTIDRLNGINSGVAIKAPCRVATTAAITLSGEQTIDGVAVVAGDRVLVKDQASSIDNGIYEVATSSWSRTPDFDGSNDVVTGTTVYVNFGTTNANTAWQVSTTGTILPGTSACAWTQSANLTTAAALFPVADSTALIKGSADATKLARFEVDGFTTGTTRVFTLPNYNGDLATVAGTELLYNKTIYNPSLVFFNAAFTRYFGFSGDALTANRTLAFPDASGTIALTTDISAPPRAVYSNLKVSAFSITQTTITADSIVLRTSGGLSYIATSVNVTNATSASGANGLDTGVRAADTWYYVYVIYNGTTVASLTSLSATSPTLPSGYTYYARVGAVRTNASSDLFYTYQVNDEAYYRIGTSPTVPRSMASGTVGDPTVPTWVAVATGAYVPTTAVKIRGRVSIQTANLIIVSSNNTAGAYNSNTNAPQVAFQPANAGGGALEFDMTLESTNIYWAAAGTTGRLVCTGWKDNL